MEEVTLKKIILVAANRIIAQFLLLSDCHFAATSLPYRKKATAYAQKRVLYSHSYWRDVARRYANGVK